MPMLHGRAAQKKCPNEGHVRHPRNADRTLRPISLDTRDHRPPRVRSPPAQVAGSQARCWNVRGLAISSCNKLRGWESDCVQVDRLADLGGWMVTEVLVNGRSDDRTHRLPCPLGVLRQTIAIGLGQPDC